VLLHGKCSGERFCAVELTLSSYIRDKRARRLQECSEKIEEFKAQIDSDDAEVDKLRGDMASIEKEINEGGAVLANLRENLRARRMRTEITALVEELESMDMEEAAKAKRNFDEKYPTEQKKENDLAGQVSDIARPRYALLISCGLDIVHRG
jgi:DNA repair protein RAD50